MNEFENDNMKLHSEEPKPEVELPEKETADQTAPAEPQTSGAAADSSENEYAKERKEEPERDIYGNTYRPAEQSFPKKKKKKITMSGSAVAFLVVCCMLVSILVGAGVNYAMNDDTIPPVQTTVNGAFDTTGNDKPSETTGNRPNTETAPSVNIGTQTGYNPGAFPEQEIYASVANQCIQSVVVIRVTGKTIAYGQEYTTSGAGSGVIFDQNGYIVTNYHVVGDKTSSISVELFDGSVYEATYIYGDEYVDLSVIKIDKNDCVAARIGNSSQMALGQIVVAIGNPLGYGLTVTPGVVSALQRSVTIENTTMTLMQTSAAINSGNSGGGLFNLNGELIGIVNAKVGGTSVEGMGFAIPSTTVVKSLNDLKEYGYITGMARLGVTVSTRQYQTWPYMQTYSYIQVAEIHPNGSAAKSGLQVGDILHQFNGVEITSFDVLSQQLTKYSVGDTITLTIRRPVVELTNNNLSEYLSTSEQIDLTITFVEFNPNVNEN